ncbi:MAG: hypothetical protein J6M55_04680, partial [Paludibacteraceae bacterium]|nr:hypothetical protein [Paludibacteraceae bacterium]
KTIASHTSTLEQTATKLSAIITDSQIAELESGTNMYDKLTVVKATADGASSSVSSLNIWKDTASGKIESLESQQNTFEQTLTGTTSRVSKIEKDYLTTSAAQTLIDQSAESVTIAVNRTIDGIKVGGRNLIINTLDPDVSKAANYPRLVGQESNTAVPGGTKTVAEHGMKIEVSSATRPYIRFGSNSASSGKMNGLEAGQTYTLSFDAKWKVLSGTITSTANYYMRAYLYTDAAKEGTFANTEYFAFATITPDDRGDEMSGRCEFTFTVPETAKMLYLLVQPSLSTSSAYASGNYIELRNIKLEKGNKCTDWTAAPEDYAGKGDALNDVVVEYATGDSPSTAPSTGWGTGSPTWTQGKYIWQRTAVTKNGQTTYSNVSCIQGAKGEAGEAVSIYSTEIKYQAHTSGTSAPTGTWQDTVPTVAQGAYLWTRTKVSYSDGTSTTSYSVGRMGSNGTNGNDGTDGISPTVTSTVTKYQQSTSGTTTPTGTWQTTPPTATAGQYMWTQTTVTYSDGATAVSYGVSRNGTNGKGISSITEYYVCTNSTSAPADSAFSTGVKT